VTPVITAITKVIPLKMVVKLIFQHQKEETVVIPLLLSPHVLLLHLPPRFLAVMVMWNMNIEVLLIVFLIRLAFHEEGD
jgi:hypothetical protein